MFQKKERKVQPGTLIVLKTLNVLGLLHDYAIARRIEQVSGDRLFANQGTLYPVLLCLKREGAISSDRGSSESNRRARFHRVTRAGRKLLQSENLAWKETAAIEVVFELGTGK